MPQTGAPWCDHAARHECDLSFSTALSYRAVLVGPHYTRVAVVQIAYHPAIVANFRSPLEDPLWDPKRGDSLIPAHGQVPDALQPDLEALRKRIRTAYDDQLLVKIQAILSTCRQHAVRLVVFPEYSIPWEILGGVADAASDMVVVAGTHTVERSARTKDKIYERLVAPSIPAVGQSVCPVLHQGRLLALVPKLNPAEPERDSMKPGEMWAPVAMPDGLPSPMAVLICLDFLFRESDRTKKVVADGLSACRFVAVPSLTSHYTTSEFAAKALEDARRYKRPVLYCDIATGGGTALYVDEGSPGDLRQFPDRPGYLDAGDEGVIIADVNLGYERGGSSTPYDSLKQVKPVAEATLVYRTNPTSAAYAQWLDDIAPILARNDDDALEDLITRIEGDRRILLDAGALSGAKARDRRLRKLVYSTGKLTSVEQIRQLVGEVVLPPNVVPLDVIRNAMAGAAADVVFEWLKRPEVRAAEFGTVEVLLRKASESGKSQSWTPETLSVKAAIAEAVRGPKEPEALEEAPAPEIKVVLPKGIDPAALGELEADGFKFRFCKSAFEFRQYQVGDPAVGNDWNPMGSALFIDAEKWSADGWCQLAIAEGAERGAVLGVMTADPSGPKGLFVLSSRGDGWVLWSGHIAASLVQHRDAIVAALGGFGLHIVAIEHLTVREQEERVHALLPIIDGAKPAIQNLRDRRLEEVSGQFEEPFARIDGNAQTPALGALNEWLDSGWPAALVLGEFGSGKSTVLAVWAEQQWNRETGPKPILVDLAGAQPGRDPESLLLDTVGVSDTPVHRAALRLLIRYRFVVPCFDGFDEIATRLGATELEGRLSALFEVARGGPGQVLVSCRSNYFATEEHLSNTTQRALQNIGSSAKARRIELVLFDSNQVEHLVRNVCERPEKGELALQKIANTYNLQDLVKRPLLLGMVVRSLEQLDTSSRVGTADLYEAYLTRWLRQTHSGDPECFTDEQKIEFGEALAEQLWRTGQPSCSWQDLQKSVRARLAQHLPEDIPLGPAFQEIQGGAFFVREGDDRFRFAHKSFFEYFFARALCRTMTARCVDVLSTKPITREVAAFVGEILRREGDPKLGNEVKTVQQFLLSGRTGALESTVEAAANALRLLHGLARWSAEPAGWIPEGANLQKVSLVRADLRDVVLPRANLSDSDLSCADLSGADMTGARLEKARFAGTKLFGTRLFNVNAKSADFLQAEADKANLEGADLRDATLRQSMWTRCRWEGARFDGADVTLWGAPGFPSEKGDLAAKMLQVRHADVDIVGGYAGGRLAFCATGSYISSAGYGSTMLWHAITGKQLGLLVDGEDAAGIWGVAWHPSAALVATGNANGTIQVWNAITGKVSSVFSFSGSEISAIVWSPNGDKLAASTRDGKIFILDTERNAPRNVLVHKNGGRRESVNAIAWHPRDDILASIGPSRAAVLWSFPDGVVLGQINKCPFSTRSLAWKSDGIHLLCANEDEAMSVDTRTGESATITKFSPTKRFMLSRCSWSADGIHLAALRDKFVEVFNCQDGSRILEIEGEATELAWHPDGKRLLCGGAPARIIDTTTGLESTRLEDGPYDRFSAVRWETDGVRVNVIGFGGHVCVWDTVVGNQVAISRISLQASYQVFWGPGTTIAVKNRNGTFLWDVRAGRQLAKLERDARSHAAVAWHPDGTKLASTDVGKITLWNASDGKSLGQFDQPKVGSATAILWHPDGRRLICAGNTLVSGLDTTAEKDRQLTQNVLLILNADNGEEFGCIGGEAKQVTGLACHPNGNWVASCDSDGILRIWDIVENRKVASCSAHEGWARAIAWHPDGSVFATTGDDGVVALWDGTTFEQVDRFKAHDGKGWVLAWHPHEHRLVSGGEDPTLKIWDPSGRRLLCTFVSTERGSFARSPGGFCLFGDGDASAFRLAVRRPEKNSRTELYLPLGGLREVLHRPDKVAAALAGDLSGDDLNAELERIGFGGGTPWDGEEHRVPEAAPPATELSKRPTAVNAQGEAPAVPAESHAFGSKYTVDITQAENQMRSIASQVDKIKPITSLFGPTMQSALNPPALAELARTQELWKAYNSPLAKEALRIKAGLEPPFSKEMAQIKALKAGLEPPFSKEMAQIKALKAGLEPTLAEEAQRIQNLFDSPIVREAQRIQKLLGPDWENIIQGQSEGDDTDTRHDFLPGAAITDSFNLPGREAILSNLIDLIKSRSPAVLLGPRRAGKTSILHTLRRRFRDADYVVYHFTFEGQHIVNKNDLAIVLDPSLEGDGRPATTLQARLIESPSVLLIDEIAHLLSADHTVFEWLRAVGQGITGIVLVGSSWDWKQVVKYAAAVTPGSSFGNDYTPVNLGPLSEADALEFLETTAPEDVPISPDGTGKWILELCGTWPFYLQVMGFAIKQAVRSGNRKALVEKIGVFDLYENRLLADRDVGYFGTRWAELPARARKVLWQLRTSGHSHPPPVRELAPEDREILRATGMVDIRQQWVEDKPFFDWIRRIADESVGNAS